MEAADNSTSEVVADNSSEQIQSPFEDSKQVVDDIPPLSPEQSPRISKEDECDKEVHEDNGQRYFNNNLSNASPTHEVDSSIHSVSSPINISSKNSYSCQFCSRLLPTSKSLDGHVLKVHNPDKVPLYICPVCSKAYRDQAQLDTHSATHTVNNTHACDHCDRRFKSRAKLRDHMASHDPEQQFLCPYPTCEKSFASKKLFDNHLAKHASQRLFFPCPLCNVEFKRRIHRSEHMRTAHPGMKAYTCTYPGCGHEFSTENARHNHMIRSHGETPCYQCMQCSFITANKIHLDDHCKQTSHTPTSDLVGFNTEKTLLPPSTVDHLESNKGTLKRRGLQMNQPDNLSLFSDNCSQEGMHNAWSVSQLPGVIDRQKILPRTWNLDNLSETMNEVLYWCNEYPMEVPLTMNSANSHLWQPNVDAFNEEEWFYLHRVENEMGPLMAGCTQFHDNRAEFVQHPPPRQANQENIVSIPCDVPSFPQKHHHYSLTNERESHMISNPDGSQHHKIPKLNDDSGAINGSNCSFNTLSYALHGAEMSRIPAFNDYSMDNNSNTSFRPLSQEHSLSNTVYTQALVDNRAQYPLTNESVRNDSLDMNDALDRSFMPLDEKLFPCLIESNSDPNALPSFRSLYQRILQHHPISMESKEMNVSKTFFYDHPVSSQHHFHHLQAQQVQHCNSSPSKLSNQGYYPSDIQVSNTFSSGTEVMDLPDSSGASGSPNGTYRDSHSSQSCSSYPKNSLSLEQKNFNCTNVGSAASIHAILSSASSSFNEPSYFTPSDTTSCPLQSPISQIETSVLTGSNTHKESFMDCERLSCSRQVADDVVPFQTADDSDNNKFNMTMPHPSPSDTSSRRPSLKYTPYEEAQIPGGMNTPFPYQIPNRFNSPMDSHKSAYSLSQSYPLDSHYLHQSNLIRSMEQQKSMWHPRKYAPYPLNQPIVQSHGSEELYPSHYYYPGINDRGEFVHPYNSQFPARIPPPRYFTQPPSQLTYPNLSNPMEAAFHNANSSSGNMFFTQSSSPHLVNYNSRHYAGVYPEYPRM